MATQVSLLPSPVLQFCDNNGVPLASGKIYTYASDGVTPKGTFSEPTGSSANPNPIVLDAGGRASIFGSGSYVWQLQDNLGNTIWTKPTADQFTALGISPQGLALIQLTSTAAMLGYLGGQVSGASGVPYGTPVPYAGATAPSGWIFCFGQQVNRSSYPNLFTAIGTTWGGGDGSTTFNVPDLRGRTWFGVDAMGGTAASRLTTNSLGTAAVLGLGSGDERLATHNHTLTDPTHYHAQQTQGSNANGGGSYANSSGAASFYGYNTQAASTGITIASSGAGANQNIPPMVVGNWIIQLG